MREPTPGSLSIPSMGTVGAWVNPSVAWISSERTSKHGLRAYARGKRRPWKRARTPNSIFLDLPIQVWHLSFTSFFPSFPFQGISLQMQMD